MELAVAQFWSSGIGSHETTVVDFEVVISQYNITEIGSYIYIYIYISVLND